MLLLILLLKFSYCYIGDYITIEDKVYKNDTFLYYYDPIELPMKNKLLTYNNLRQVCNRHIDCQKNWCSSGAICSENGYCLNLMDYPCHHTMNCNYNKKICEPITCFILNQCDDNIYCNGKEICFDRICKRTDYPCKFGTCIESNKSCTFINNITSKLNNELPQFKTQYSKEYASNFANITDIIKIDLSGPPLWDANSLEVQVIFLVFFIIFALLVIGLCILNVFIPCCCKRK